MKTLLLFLAFCISLYLNPLQAQYQSFFGDNNTSWKCLAVSGTTIAGPSLDSLVFVGEQDWGGETFQVFGIYFVETNPGFEIWQSSWIEPDPALENYLWMRETEGHDKLYCSFGTLTEKTGEEILVCDLTLEEGDEFITPVTTYLVELVTTDSEQRKLIALSDGNADCWMLEGVGAANFSGLAYFWGDILCQEKDGIVTFEITTSPFSDWCTQAPLTIRQLIDPSTVSLFPNPGSGSFALQTASGWPASAGELSLYNAAGETVLQMPVGANLVQLEVPTSQLSAGLYTVVLRFNSGETLITRYVEMK